jgi:aspartyl-tRNA(Asn)/glutamyl-tRNA(Gln) amidotransferase subunit B
MEYEVVIGLEVHVQLLTESKLFCGCSTRFGDPPNQNTCPVCLGLPGSLPVLNRKAVDFAIKAALSLGCDIKGENSFSRKNYFYPDLPKGYQITQYRLPLAEKGYIEIETGNGAKRIGLERIILEEDAGKLLHEGLSESETKSYIDFNRCGVPLAEIVSRPEIATPEEAHQYLINLKTIMRYIEVSDCNMEEGSLRCDTNVSIKPRGSKASSVRAEIKNLNSFKSVQRALEYEIERQKNAIAKGERIVLETRLWDEKKQETVPMRSKEEAHDYRYFPEPDLVAVEINDEWIEQIRTELPEMPQAKKERFIKQYGIPAYDSAILTLEKPLADYYEECVSICNNPKAASNWIMVEVLRELKNDNIEIIQCPITSANLGSLIKLIDKGTISGKIAKEVFEEMYSSGDSPENIIKKKGITQITDEDEITRVVEQVIQENARAAEEYKQGKTRTFGFLVGQIMKATHGKANPQLANKILRDLLEKDN